MTRLYVLLVIGVFFTSLTVSEAFAANANLFVSAENSDFDNYMSGPQVIEVVIIDSEISDTDESHTEPNVTVNGKKLRMVQATDGNWYAYFADRDMAQIADSTATVAGSGLDFGKFCSASSAGGGAVLGGTTGITFTDTMGVAVKTGATGGVDGASEGGTITATCTALGIGSYNNVVREAKTSNNVGGSIKVGQIDIDPLGWPFIQLYQFTQGGNVVVQYNKGGANQYATLTFDTADGFAELSLDHTKYSVNTEVLATITDLRLNIDPTDEDVWTFGTNVSNSTSYGAYYAVFNEDGEDGGKAINIKNTLANLMCEDCLIQINPKVSGVNNVLTIQENYNSNLQVVGTDPDDISKVRVEKTTRDETDVLGQGSQPVTIIEQNVNSGIFTTYDYSDQSTLKITSNAARGTSASINYNDEPYSIVVGFFFATIDIQPTDDEWNSGEEIPIVIADGDANRNSRIDENLDLYNPDVTIIPALETGDPFTIGEAGTGTSTVADIGYATTATVSNNQLTSFSGITTSTETVQKFSERVITEQSSTPSIAGVLVDFDTTMSELASTVRGGASFHGSSFLNLDVRSLTTGTVDVYLVNATSDIFDGTTYSGSNPSAQLIGTAINAQSLTKLADAMVENIQKSGDAANKVSLLIKPNTPSTFTVDAKEAFVADFISFGFLNDGVYSNQRVSNQIIRIEAEETGDNTATFSGSLEFIMLNQLNILDENVYLGLRTIADDPTFIAIEDLTDEDSPRVSYFDVGADGVATQISDQQEIPTHSGSVSFDSSRYGIGDTVTVTLEDMDLNVNSELIDIYTAVPISNDANRDTIGSAEQVYGGTSIELSTGKQLGRLLEITFDDQRWTKANSCGLDADISSGLEDSGFTLVETGLKTGVFTGDFEIPSHWCSSGAVSPDSVVGVDLGVIYVDYRDASGDTIEVSDIAAAVSEDRVVYPVSDNLYGTRYTSIAILNPVSVDSSGNLFNGYGNKVERTDVSKNTQTKWTLPNDYEYRSTKGAVDSSGYYYFLVNDNDGNDKLLKLNHNTDVFTEWDLNYDNAGYYGIAIDSLDNIFIPANHSNADDTVTFLLKIDPDTNIITTYNSSDGIRYNSDKLFIDDSDELYFFGYDDSKRYIVRFNPDANQITAWEISSEMFNNSIRNFDGTTDGIVYFAETYPYLKKIAEFDTSTGTLKEWKSPYENLGRLAVDSEGNVFFHGDSLTGFSPVTEIFTKYSSMLYCYNVDEITSDDKIIMSGFSNSCVISDVSPP